MMDTGAHRSELKTTSTTSARMETYCAHAEAGRCLRQGSDQLNYQISYLEKIFKNLHPRSRLLRTLSCVETESL